MFVGVIFEASMSYSTTSGHRLTDTTISALIVMSLAHREVSTGRNNYIEWIVATNDRILVLDKLKFFSAVYARTSVVSRLLLAIDGNFPVAKAALDPNALIAIIHKTHFKHVDESTPSRRGKSWRKHSADRAKSRR